MVFQGLTLELVYELRRSYLRISGDVKDKFLGIQRSELTADIW